MMKILIQWMKDRNQIITIKRAEMIRKKVAVDFNLTLIQSIMKYK